VRVGLSLLTLVPRISGGSETYARELVRALGAVGAHQYRVLLPRIADDVEGLPSEVVDEYRASRSTPGRMLAMGEGVVRGGRLRARLAGCDVVHFPLTVMIPRVASPPAVTTVLDLQHETLPQFFSRAELAYRRAAYGWSVRRSALVITISEHAARAIVDRFDIAPERVRPIHLGVDHGVFSPGAEAREQFLVYPAREWPHKNHARLFEAFARVRAERPELRLVLTGVGHEPASLPEGAETRGGVSTDELVSLYLRASALVFPSLYEGFGLPPVEAMACGCPVAASDAGSLPEVVGDAAVLFDPRDPESIAAGITEALDRADELRGRGIAHATGFTWDATARAHDRVYEAAYSA
jgi:glycosyltransferase involved in cell wall biosynthesis